MNRANINVGNYALDQSGGTAIVRSSQLISTSTSWLSQFPGTLRIVGSQIGGGTAGSCAGAGNYDVNYLARPNC